MPLKPIFSQAIQEVFVQIYYIIINYNTITLKLQRNTILLLLLLLMDLKCMWSLCIFQEFSSLEMQFQNLAFFFLMFSAFSCFHIFIFLSCQVFKAWRRTPITWFVKKLQPHLGKPARNFPISKTKKRSSQGMLPRTTD